MQSFPSTITGRASRSGLSRTLSGVTVALAAIALSACSDGTSPSSANNVGVGFQLARTSSAAALMSSSINGSAPSVPARRLRSRRPSMA